MAFIKKQLAAAQDLLLDSSTSSVVQERNGKPVSVTPINSSVIPYSSIKSIKEELDTKLYSDDYKFTPEYEAKINGIEAEANKYIHPTMHHISIIDGLGNEHLFVKVDGTGATGFDYVRWSDIQGKPADLDNVEFTTNKGVPNGYAPLDATGKINPNFLFSLNLLNTFTAEDQASMLALTEAGAGDIVFRNDTSDIYMLVAMPASTLGNWKLLNTVGVSSVNGQTSIVSLSSDDVPEGTTHKYATEAEKTKVGYMSITQAVNLDTIESDTVLNNTHRVSTANPHSVTKTQVGLSNVDNTTDLLKPVSTATQSALDLKLDASANAVSASKLITARNINGVSFDGTADITIADSTKAPLASPALIGTPTAPTPIAGDNTTQIATTEFVIKNSKIAEVETINDLISIDTLKYVTCIVKEEGRGGIFNYDATQSSINNGGTIFDGWKRQYDGAVNVKWFGAKGDGVTNDTLAIQKALTLHKFIVGDLADTYLTGALKVFSDTHILNMKLRASVDVSILSELLGLTDAAILTVYNGNNIIIENVYIDGSLNLVGKAVGIHCYKDCTNIRVDKCSVSNMAGDGISFYDNITDFVVSDCIVTNVGIGEISGDGILVHARCRRGFITNNLVNSCNVIGIEIEGRIGNDDSNIQRCYDIEVTNNIIRACTAQSMFINWSNNIKVSNLSYYDSQAIHIIGSKNVVIENIYGEGSDIGITTDDDGFTNQIANTNLTIENIIFNYISIPSAPRWAEGTIYIDNTTNCKISNINIELPSETNSINGICVESTSSKASIYNCKLIYFTNNISIKCSSVVLSGCYLESKYYGTPLLLATNLNNISIFNNEMYRGNNTILVQGLTNSKIQNNYIRSSDGNYNIFMVGAYSSIIISGNNIYNGAKVPIYLDEGATFTNVIFNDNIAIGSNFNSKAYTGTNNILS